MNIIQSTLRNNIVSVFSRAGFNIRRKRFTLSYCRQKLIEILNIASVIDVGANIGQYASSLREEGYQGNIISFEPLTNAFIQLQENAKNDPLWECQNLALGNRIDDTVEINVAANSVSSSFLNTSPILKKQESLTQVTEKQCVSMVTLDSLAEELKVKSRPTLLKIDSQGMEKPILEGALTLLPDIVGIELELALLAVYDNQDTIVDLLTYLKELEFEMVHIEPAFFAKPIPCVLEANGIFLRKDVLHRIYDL